MSLKTFMSWQSLKVIVLMFTFCGASFILAKLLLDNRPIKDRIYKPSAFVFPTEIPLPEWQFESSTPLALPENKVYKNRLIASRAYTYKQGKRTLTIEMRYTKDTSGNVLGFISNFTSVDSGIIAPSRRIERYHKGVGYYVLLNDQNRVYLTSCINPRGESTVTLPQFQRNRYYHDMNLDRLMLWLFKPATLRDFRCLWVHASVPVDNLSLNEAYTTLESAWFSWEPWWEKRFPSP
jgi:cyanosortase A-associated protein